MFLQEPRRLGNQAGAAASSEATGDSSPLHLAGLTAAEPDDVDARLPCSSEPLDQGRRWGRARDGGKARVRCQRVRCNGSTQPEARKGSGGGAWMTGA